MLVHFDVMIHSNHDLSLFLAVVSDLIDEVSKTSYISMNEIKWIFKNQCIQCIIYDTFSSRHIPLSSFLSAVFDLID